MILAESTTTTINEQMYDSMEVKWEEIDSFLNKIESSRSSDSKNAWGRTWAANKEHIFKAWGNKTRIEKDVELSLSKHDVKSEMRSMINRLREGGKVSEITLGIVSIVAFYLPFGDILENKLSQKVRLFGIDFGAGMKVSKMIGKLVLDEKERYEVQTAYSLSAQSFKASGKLVMSIDPFDLLTMSYNPDSDWRSCHNIVDGEFRAGPISYICDGSTFIAYVYRRKESSEFLPSVEVPNKTWRQIGYFSKEMDHIALSTHYPSVNKNNRKTVVSLITEVLGLENVRHGFIDCSLLESTLMRDETDLHYNDLTHGRADRGYMIDLQGQSPENEFEQYYYSLYRKDECIFTVGFSNPTSFTTYGHIVDSGYIDGTEYDDDDGYDDDDDDMF